jgi:acyl carrier protein
VITKITNIPTNEIPDTASYRDDLALDSLSALEVMVDVEYEFQIKVPEAESANVRTIEETVLLVQRYLDFATV